MSDSQKKQDGTPQGVNRRDFIFRGAIGAGAVALSGALLGCGSSGTQEAISSAASPSLSSWKFGVMADTQWTVANDGSDPYSVAANIISQINNQFISNGVKFVVQVGDLTDQSYNGHPEYLDMRARMAQSLYNAGIGFYPLRGNHEDLSTVATRFQTDFPQTQNGVNNNSPAAVLALTMPDGSADNAVSNTGSTFTLGSNFNSPTSDLDGLSYAFDYSNARFVFLDQFSYPNSAYSTNTSIAAQQSWITSMLSGRTANTHAFVFGHKGLITENHADVLFGNDPSQNATATDAFIKSLANNGAHYYIFGHDHMHERSIVTTTDGTTASVNQLLCASDSSKFYIPANPTNDSKYNSISRQTVLQEDLYKIGFYIFTVTGALVTVDYYAADSGAVDDGSEYLISSTPTLSFVKKETFGYALNGKEYVIAQGGSYTGISSTSSLTYGTTAKILSGSNLSIATDAAGRKIVKAVDTGWLQGQAVGTGAASDMFSLCGMQAALGSTQTDTYTLSLSYLVTAGTSAAELHGGHFGLATLDSSGNWAAAVNKNTGGTSTFVAGPWEASYGLGTWGVDIATGTAWAVLNHNGLFAVVYGI